MALSSELISQFVKITNDDKAEKTETSHYGEVVIYNDKKYVRLDGSDVLTPVSTTASVADGERVLVTIKDHTATVTGNITSPSPSSGDVQAADQKAQDAIDQISAFEIVIADKADISDLTAAKADIENLKTDKLDADDADLKYATITNLEAAQADIDNLEVNKLSAEVAEATYATINGLEATNADIHNLEATYGDFAVATADRLEAHDAVIDNLETTYAEIDFANINQAAVTKLFTDSGIIEDLVVSEGRITGELVGVTIHGDLIKGNTVKADKLVVLGSDGIYYKLNFDGGTFAEGEAVPTDSLHGSVITAHSITASKVSVDDLVAFDATIGGFNITDDAIYSGVKAGINSNSAGIYLDNTGQMAVGDGDNYIKYFKDTDGTYKLEISAKSLSIHSGSTTKSVEEAITDIQGEIDTMKDEITTNLRIESSRGTVFKNNAVSTVLTAVIYRGSQRITDMASLRAAMGSTAYLQWKWQRLDDESFGILSASDSRFSNDGFTFTLSPEDVDTKVTFMCELIT